MNNGPANVPVLTDRELFRNSARFMEEASHGLKELLDREGKTQAWLASRLGRSRSYVNRLMEGSHNATLETIANAYLAFGRAVHLTLGADPEEMRMPVDEGSTAWIDEPDGEFRTLPMARMCEPQPTTENSSNCMGLCA